MYIISVIIIIYLLRRGVLLPKGVISVNINMFKPVIHMFRKYDKIHDKGGSKGRVYY